MSKEDNKRIAKNAAALYIRMFVSMIVGLFTTRIVLQELGVEDYGIYNVVGGFVSMFTLISGSLEASVGRFLTYELGTGNLEKLKKVFSSSLLVMIGLSIIVVIATETIGIWYLNNKMVLPESRINAAFWCFQFSLASFVLRLLGTPYTSSIVSHEHMGIYAYMSILDVVLRLLVCFLIVISPIDKLVFYSILLFAVGLINQLILWAYCRKKFEECFFHFSFDKGLFKNLFSFAGWNLIGSSSVVLRNQGATLLLNYFGGPIVNAANGISNNICSIVSGFVSNFTQAFNPQITKKYAAGEYESLMRLLIYGSKYSYFLMFILSLPVFLNANILLQLWLGEVPEYTVAFSRWMFVFLLSETISRPIITAKNANGDIKKYQIIVGGILLLMLPLSYIGLCLGLSVTFVGFANAITSILAFFARMYMLRGDFPEWSSRVFFKEVFLRVMLVTVIASILPVLSYIIIEEGIINLIVTSIICIISSGLCIYFIGCSKAEKDLFNQQAQKLLLKIRKR